MERYEEAIGDAGEVLKICERTGFRFYEPEAEMVLARAYLSQKDFEKAETNAKSAYEKAAGEWMKKAVRCRRKIKDPKVKESEAILEGL